MDFDNDFIYLTVENVKFLHDLTLEEFGGIQGIELGKLEAKLALPVTGFGDYEHYPTLEEKAAVYLFELATGHCFKDGNKRTSLLAMAMFLELNGYELTAGDFTTYFTVLHIANDKTRPPFEQVVMWVSENIKPKEE